ncbi:hypothetical protein HDU96_003477 [Phlyctochytrium bullatum]|nr:hypothetical protein HDU96_003477 [Phlyctochytrium bullatum]
MFSLLTPLFIALLAVTAQARVCINRDGPRSRSIVVFDQYVNDFNSCRWWNNLINTTPRWGEVFRSVTHVCAKPNINEIGIIITNGIDEASAEDVFGLGCQSTNQGIYRLLTTTGWQCLDLNQFKVDCEGRQGIDVWWL